MWTAVQQTTARLEDYATTSRIPNLPNIITEYPVYPTPHKQQGI